jgi:lysophospholipase L1-like esterase
MYFPAVFELSEAASDRWEVSTAICRDIQAEFAKHDARVLFVLIPAPYQVDQAAFAKYVEAFNIDVSSVDLELPNRLLAQRFLDASLRLVDPLAEMRLRQQAGTRLYGSVDRHLNAEGHSVLAEILLPVIETLVAEGHAGRT